MMAFIILALCMFSFADAKFSTKTIVFNNGVSVKVEMAETVEQKTQGLMHRDVLRDGEGMLFVFKPAQYLSFWMKNTRIPLDIGFFSESKRLIEVKSMEPVLGPVLDEKLPRYESSQPAMYALEVPRGWFAKKKLRQNSSFRFQ